MINGGRRRIRMMALAAVVLAAVPIHATAQAPDEEDRGAPDLVLNTGYTTWWGLWHLGTVEASLGLGGRTQLTGQLFHGYRRATNLGCFFEWRDCSAWWGMTGVLGGLRWVAGERIQPFFGLQGGVFTFEHSAGRGSAAAVGALAGLQVWALEKMGVYVQGAILASPAGAEVPVISLGAGLSFRLGP